MIYRVFVSKGETRQHYTEQSFLEELVKVAPKGVTKFYTLRVDFNFDSKWDKYSDVLKRKEELERGGVRSNRISLLAGKKDSVSDETSSQDLPKIDPEDID